LEGSLKQTVKQMCSSTFFALARLGIETRPITNSLGATRGKKGGMDVFFSGLTLPKSLQPFQ
jgi:hypothetical protein